MLSWNLFSFAKYPRARPTLCSVAEAMEDKKEVKEEAGIDIKPEDLEVKADKRIIFNSYKSNGVSKAEDSIEYQRLENLWGSKVR